MVRVLARALVVVGLVGSAAAAPPSVLVYRGELSRPGGGAVDDVVPMVFRLHESPDALDDVLRESALAAVGP